MDEKSDAQKKTGTKPQDALDLRELCRVWSPFEADVLKSFLEGHGVPCLVRGQIVPYVYPITVDGLGEFTVFVRDEDLETARELMASRPAPDDQGGSGEAGEAG
jgi:hypothetical protein